MVFIYLVMRLQQHLPLNPDGFAGVNPYVSFNTAASFMTNTNWQAYGGETTMSYLTQMLALTFQNFVSAAVGIAVADRDDPRIHAGRDRRRRELLARPRPRRPLRPAPDVGPGRVVLMTQGVVQTLGALATVTGVQGFAQTDRARARSPSQIAIKQLGTNGGGFFNVNSAHPFESATPLCELRRDVRDPVDRRGAHLHVREDGRQRPAGLGDLRRDVDPAWWPGSCSPCPASVPPRRRCRRRASPRPRRTWRARRSAIGPDVSSLWAVATTDASNGSVNSMHDSYQPLGVARADVQHRRSAR